MSKKEKFIHGMYIFTGDVNTVFIMFFCFLGIGYFLDVPLYFTKAESINNILVLLSWAITVSCILMLFVDFFIKKINNFARNPILLSLSLLLCVQLVSTDSENNIIKICIFVVMNILVRKLIEFAVKKEKYNPACIGYKDVFIKREEVSVFPMYSKEVWKNFILHIDECSEEQKKIMAREIEIFADRIYRLDQENLKLISVFEDKRSYVKQVEIYYDQKNQRLVKYYRYDYENCENMGRLEKLILRLGRKRMEKSN